jgi:hypothetical protein
MLHGSERIIKHKLELLKLAEELLGFIWLKYLHEFKKCLR